MSLTSDFDPFTSDGDDPLPGTVFAARTIGTGPLPAGALVVMTVLAADHWPTAGTLYILDDGAEAAVVRASRISTAWIEGDEYLPDGTTAQRRFKRDQWSTRASLTIAS
jgi:hypothetical protein